MQFQLSGQWSNSYLRLPVRSTGYLLLAFYLILFVSALYRQRGELRRWRAGKFIFFLGLVLAVVPLNNALILSLPGSEPPSALTSASGAVEYKVFLLAAVPILLAAPLGVMPAGVVGLVGGLVRGALVSHRLSHSFEMALFGLIVGYLIQQDYRGRLPSALRQPLLASLLAVCFLWPILFFSLYVYVSGPALFALVRYGPFLATESFLSLVEGLIAGLVLQVLFLVQPSLRPVVRGKSVPPYSRSLNRRLLVFFVPMTLAIILVLFPAVNITAIRIATKQTVIQTARDASNATGRIPFFFQTGQRLITEFARDELLQNPDSAARQAQLDRDMHTLAFFSQLSLLDDEQQPLNTYPQSSSNTLTLTNQERALVTRVMETQAAQVSPVHPTPDGRFVISFIARLYSEPSSERGDKPHNESLAKSRPGEGLYGLLIGRADLESNSMMRGILADLQWTMGAGIGFIVDERGLVVAHPDHDLLLSTWQASDRPERFLDTPQGRAYEEVGPDGMKQLVYYLPVEGQPWTVVIMVPEEVIIDLAAQISTPILIILSLIGVASSAFIPLVTGRLTRPIQALAQAATRIAHGQLEVTVKVSGEDEVGRLSTALERMRGALKQRLEELSLLLEISQAVSASRDLERGLGPILQGAMQATAAFSARIILLTEAGEDGSAAVEKTLVKKRARAASWERTPRLDEATLRIIRTREPLLITNAPRAAGSVDPALIQAGLRATVGLPLTVQKRIVGVMWVDYPSPREFSESEVSFLSTLASQAAVVIENARLFEAIESERSRLATILSSTSDAILVTDNTNKVLLVNPAAEQTFNLEAEEATGRPLLQVVANDQLGALLMQPTKGKETLTKEIDLPDGRVLYASASPIFDGEGQAIGRVAVMRDITHLKELNNMKSEFVSTVSHDLRSPLTFMRGYTTMIPMVGEVNPKQQEFIENIVKGIEQMTELIDDLLDIGKIEAGVGVRMTSCQVDEIIKEVMENLQGRADIKRLTLKAELPEHLPAVIGDPTLLRQAITNLLDNAIKYTPAGSVTIGAEENDSQIVVSVKDTGLGIAPADQMRLFEKFYRVKRRETVKIKGTGLGLAIVKSIAERHNGKVWVESKLNVGSTFYLALPKDRVDS